MKRFLILLLSFIFSSIFVSAQQRHLPNQFRDYVDHQQRLQMERPKVEKKDGKVVITMTEEQFERMRQVRMSQRSRFAHFRPQPQCNKCVKRHKRHTKKHF